MNSLWIVLVMTVIGAIIGGVTNSLAIKMLFRPYEAKYLGGWKVPFTPGVIPKRRDLLAKQLGQLVVTHLITSESLQSKLKEPVIRKQLIQQLIHLFHQLKQTHMTLADVVEKYQLPWTQSNVQQQVRKWAVDQYQHLFHDYKDKRLKDLFPFDKSSETWIRYVRSRAISMSESDSTKQRLAEIIDQYAQSKGFFGNMFLSMFSSEDMAERVQTMISTYLQSDEGYEWIRGNLLMEMNALFESPLKRWETYMTSDEAKQKVGDIVETYAPIDSWFHRPISEFLQPMENHVTRHLIPRLADVILDRLQQQMPTLLARLEVEKMVEHQVASFPTERIEQIVLTISKKEFTLITYLGAFLGGIIGLIQGIFYIVFG
ncbi:hypothetical protein J416_14732 [Gracilibacillus halophilus YIM-C55.5]|uniref:Uncharacterized protein n=1 Tax=Gracilibacillus halophilus YIM-C55.5 TaxID=1308866 RepID=N4WR77_9BACI|nr:DUF445 family protein [Gracilibacillus halophilus]ENH95721.1 hypothetical protein J416_14732 [Gracilibacillus halophilus YIM-C55.5]